MWSDQALMPVSVVGIPGLLSFALGQVWKMTIEAMVVWHSS
jgi:hypothetical protein